jgi:hypothetical protein
MRADDIALGFVVLFCGSLIAIMLMLGVVSYRAEPAEIACRSQGMDHVRRSFRMTVTCVPRTGHAVDTIYIRSAD